MGGAKFGQVECGKLLKRCQTNEDAFAVLSAYAFAKYARGSNSAQVARKLHLALCYFRAIQMHEQLTLFHEAFLLVTYHVRHLDGQALGSCPASTAIGIEAWNVTRRICAKRDKSGLRSIDGSAALTPVGSISSGYLSTLNSRPSQDSGDGSLHWRPSEDAVADDYPDHPPPELPSYNDAARPPPAPDTMSVSWLR